MKNAIDECVKNNEYNAQKNVDYLVEMNGVLLLNRVMLVEVVIKK